MPAGLNLVAKVWNYVYDAGLGDDEIGGAQPSGTVSYSIVNMRIQALRPTQAILEQGIDTINTYVGLIHPHTVVVENNNEIEVTAPAHSPYYGKHFRVRGDPQRTSTGASDSRGYLLVSLQHIEKSRSIQ